MTGLEPLVTASFLISTLALIRTETRMSHFGAQYDDLLAAMNENLNKVSLKMTHLLDEVAKRGDEAMTDKQFAAFEAIRDHLAALGSDVQTPIVPVPAAVEAIPEPVKVSPAPDSAPVSLVNVPVVSDAKVVKAPAAPETASDK
jgi:hypothetical protein